MDMQVSTGNWLPGEIREFFLEGEILIKVSAGYSLPAVPEDLQVTSANSDLWFMHIAHATDKCERKAGLVRENKLASLKAMLVRKSM